MLPSQLLHPRFLADLPGCPHLQEGKPCRHQQLQANYCWGASHLAVCQYPQCPLTAIHRKQWLASTHSGRLSAWSKHHSSGFCTWHVIDKHKRRKDPLYLCFVDLNAAYDRVQWQLIWRALRRLWVGGHILVAIQSLDKDCQVAVKVGGANGDTHRPSVGLKQGCPLSANLLGLFIDELHQYLQDAVRMLE